MVVSSPESKVIPHPVKFQALRDVIEQQQQQQEQQLAINCLPAAACEYESVFMDRTCPTGP